MSRTPKRNPPALLPLLGTSILGGVGLGTGFAVAGKTTVPIVEKLGERAGHRNPSDWDAARQSRSDAYAAYEMWRALDVPNLRDFPDGRGDASRENWQAAYDAHVAAGAALRHDLEDAARALQATPRNAAAPTYKTVTTKKGGEQLSFLNPLARGYAPATISHNIAKLRREGWPQDRAVAVAYAVARKDAPVKVRRRLMPKRNPRINDPRLDALIEEQGRLYDEARRDGRKHDAAVADKEQSRLMYARETGNELGNIAQTWASKPRPAKYNPSGARRIGAGIAGLAAGAAAGWFVASVLHQSNVPLLVAVGGAAAVVTGYAVNRGEGAVVGALAFGVVAGSAMYAFDKEYGPKGLCQMASGTVAAVPQGAPPTMPAPMAAGGSLR